MMEKENEFITIAVRFDGYGRHYETIIDRKNGYREELVSKDGLLTKHSFHRLNDDDADKMVLPVYDPSELAKGYAEARYPRFVASGCTREEYDIDRDGKVHEKRAFFRNGRLRLREFEPDKHGNFMIRHYLTDEYHLHVKFFPAADQKLEKRKKSEFKSWKAGRHGLVHQVTLDFKDDIDVICINGVYMMENMYSDIRGSDRQRMNEGIHVILASEQSIPENELQLSKIILPAIQTIEAIRASTPPKNKKAPA